MELLTLAIIVVVEKPFTPTQKEADALIAIAKKNNLLLTVFQSMYIHSRFFFVFPYPAFLIS